MTEEYTSEELIKFIEYEALRDIKDIDVSPDKESNIDYDCVQIWYLEAEKLIRILANILPATMAQPINQLRYAGHHILKAAVAELETIRTANLIEAYKHCKRAYFDSLDLYVFHMAEVFRGKASLLSLSDDFEERIKGHLSDFTSLRLAEDRRIDYYLGVSKKINDGLGLVAEINLLLKEGGITDGLLKDKLYFVGRIDSLEKENAKINNMLDREISKSENKFNRRFTYMSVFVLLVTAGSILFQGYFTEKLVTSKSESLLMIENIPSLDLALQPKTLNQSPPQALKTKKWGNKK